MRIQIALAAVVLATSVSLGASSSEAERPLPLPLRKPSGDAILSYERGDERYRLLSNQQTTELIGSSEHTLGFGDSDLDGRNEVFMNHRDTSVQKFYYKILELDEEGNYIEVHSEENGFDPYCTGFLDGDNRLDVVGISGGLQVYESPADSALATQNVWSTSVSNVNGWPTIADSDLDGVLEIIHSNNTFGSSELRIFESIADNFYVEKYRSSVLPEPIGEKLVSDIDGDSWPEIIMAGLDGGIYSFEASSNDTWDLIWYEDTKMFNAYATEGGRDLNKNGKREFFAMGQLFEAPSTAFWATRIYEPVCDNYYAVVDSIIIESPYVGVPYNELGNTNADSQDEYIFNAGDGYYVYQYIKGRFHATRFVEDPGPSIHQGLFLEDMNKNHIMEVYWTSRPSTLVIETDIPTSSQPTRASLNIRAYPNPTSGDVLLQLPRVGSTARLVTYDVRGRLVRSTVVRNGDSVLRWNRGELAPGVYWLALVSAGEGVSRGRITLLR